MEPFLVSRVVYEWNLRFVSAVFRVPQCVAMLTRVSSADEAAAPAPAPAPAPEAAPEADELSEAAPELSVASRLSLAVVSWTEDSKLASAVKGKLDRLTSKISRKLQSATETRQLTRVRTLNVQPLVC